VALLLYLIVATATLFVWHRYVTPLSRGAAILILALPFVFTAPALLTNRAYGGYDILFMVGPWSDYAKDFGFIESHNWSLVDQLLQFVPWQHQVRVAFANGEWPLWNPAMDAGEVLAANMQSAPLNPLNLIAMLLPLPLATAFDAAMVFFLAALFTFALAREFECSEHASLVAATAFTLSSAMAFHVGWPHARSWTTLPFILLAVHRRSYALLTIALTLLIVFGHPETMLHVVVIGVSYGLFELIDDRQRLRTIAIAFAAGITAFLLTAITLLPFIAILGETWEYRARASIALQPQTLAAHDFVKSIGATFIPYFGGASWLTPAEWDFGTARVGSVTLALAIIAVFRFWRRREVRFLLGMLLLTLLACWRVPPMSTLLRHLPLFNVSLNERFGIGAALALSLLAGFGAQWGGGAPAAARRIVMTIGFLLAIATALTWRTRLGYHIDHRLMFAGAIAEAFGLICLWFALRRRGAAAPLSTVMLILVAIVAQRVVEDGNIYPRISKRMFFPSVPLIAKIPRDPMFRVVATGTMLTPNAATMYGLEDVRGYSATTYFPYLQTMSLWCPDATRNWHDVNDLSRPFLNFLGVRHALTPRTMNPPDGWRVVADDRNSRLMENTRAIPRVFVPHTIRFVANDDVEMQEMSAATDFAETVWIDSRKESVAENGDAAIRTRRVGSHYEIDADVRTGARIVITESSWPGWRAYVDDRRVKIERANRAFLAVFVPQGHHHVRVVYLPDAFVIGRAISIATLLALAVAVSFRVRRGASRDEPIAPRA